MVASQVMGKRFTAGQRVGVTQQIAQRDEAWTIRVEGVVVRCEQKKTGSWYAHSKDDKLWLDRLVIRKDDGEIVVCNLDQYTHVEVLPPNVSEATPAASASQDGGAQAVEAQETGNAA